MKNLTKQRELKTELSANMTRKERRAWFHANRKDLNLPRWRELHNLNVNQ